MAGNNSNIVNSEATAVTAMSCEADINSSRGGGTDIPYSKTNSKEQDNILLEPYAYLMLNPGKNIRTKLVKAFNVWLNVPEKKAEEIGDIIQMLHNAR